MPTRLSLFCTRIIEAGWLVALVVVPLHFNPASSRAFEPDKIALLRSIAVLMAVAWLVKAGEAWWGRRHRGDSEPVASETPSAGRRLAAHPLVWIAGFMLASYGLSTALSILPDISVWGYYGRLHGLYTAASYLVVFVSMVALLRTSAQVQRLITAVVIGSVPVALYGLVQHLGLDPLVWAEPTSQRVHATMGNPIFLAATLSMAVPLTVYRLATVWRRRRFVLLGGYSVVLAVQLAAMVFAQSRGPVLGLIVGMLFGGLLWALTQHRWKVAKGVLGFAAVLTVLLALVNLSDSVLAVVEDVPYLNRLVRLDEGEGSAEGRVLVWEGAVDLILADPMRLAVGYGPEAIRFAYYPYYTTTLAQIHGDRVFFDRMHNETFDVLVTTGLVGFIFYLLFFTSLVYYGLRWLGLLPPGQLRYGFWFFWIGGGLGATLGLRWIAQTWAFSGVALPLGMLGGLLLYLAVYTFYAPRQAAQDDASASAGGNSLLLILLFAGLLGHFVEINVGIAVSATRLLFWAYVALFLVLGLSGMRLADAKQQSTAQSSRPAYGALLVMSQCAGFIAVTLLYSFFIGDAFSEGRAVLAGLFGAMWLLIGVLLVFGIPPDTGKRPLGRALGLYVVFSVLPLLSFVVFLGRSIEGSLHHLVLYLLIIAVFILSTGLLLGRETPRPARRASLLGLALVVLGGGAGLAFVYSTNIQIIQANMYHLKAKTAFQQRQYDEAALQYRRALDLDPRQELYQLELAQLLATQARYQPRIAPARREQLFQAAEDILVRASAKNPFEQYHYAALAEVYLHWAYGAVSAQLRDTRYEQAFSAFSQALRVNPGNIGMKQRWAEAYEEKGDRRQALATYRQVLADDTTNVALYMRIGKLYSDEQQWDEAAVMYEGAVRHSEQPRPNVYQLLVTLYQRIGRLDRAAQTAERALALDPDSPAHHDLLIGVYVRQGQCSKAREQLRLALEQWPGNARFQTLSAWIDRHCTPEAGPE